MFISHATKSGMSSGLAADFFFLKPLSSTQEAENQLFALYFRNKWCGQLPEEEFKEGGHGRDILLALKVHPLPAVPPLPQLLGPRHGAAETKQASVLHPCDETNENI